MIKSPQMFGPNNQTLYSPSGSEHHRGPWYRTLLRRTIDLFRQRFDVHPDYDVIIMTGSGTLANQAALYTFGGTWSVRHKELEFGSRLHKFAAYADIYNQFSGNEAWVQYDTATSTLNLHPPTKVGLWLVDAVSSFPYYAPPAQADVWVTVSSKQLGALPVLGIVVVRPSAWAAARIGNDQYSYLNLLRWREAQVRGESPHTPAIPLVESLYESLLEFDPAAEGRRIDARRDMLMPKLHQHVVGDGPVLTLLPGAVPERVAEQFDLYKSKGGGHQLFLWSGTDEQYAHLLRAL